MKRRLSVAIVFLFAIGASARQSDVRSVPKDVTVLGFRLHYIEAGRGAPVILLHGLGGDGSRWGPVIEPLARDFRVIALDQIGFGESDKPLANYHSGMLADYLAGFMRAVGIPTASLVGNSMGASVSQYMAVHYPAMVDRLVLVDGTGYRRRPGEGAPPDPHLRQIQNGVTLEETREFFRILFYDKSRVTDRLVEEQLIMRLRAAYTITKMQEAGDKGLGGVTEEETRAIRAPTLIIWGKYDELASPAGADRLERDIPGSRKVLIDRAGHMPQIEQPEEFARIVRDFLKSGR